jgi:excisionase family DNA binding protein
MGKLLSIERVARMLDVSTKTVRRMVESGELPEPILLSGKMKRWLKKDINIYLGRLIERASQKKKVSRPKAGGQDGTTRD